VSEAARHTRRRYVPYDPSARTILAASALLFALLLAGCGAAGTDAGTSAETPATEAAAAFPVTITDDAGREVTIESEPQRIVSLAPANTEIIAALGLIDRLVGVTSFDDYPPEVASIDIIGDFASPNLEAVAAAEPDIVLATSGVQADVIGQLENLGAVVVAVDPADLESLFGSIAMVGEATGTSGEADTIVSSMRSQLDEITVAIGDATPVPVFLEIAQDPALHRRPGNAARRPHHRRRWRQHRHPGGLRGVLRRTARGRGPRSSTSLPSAPCPTRTTSPRVPATPTSTR
jgi:iron complex transport system substrate-binding protein